MPEPIFRDGQWWFLSDGGRWLRWDPAGRWWIPDASGPATTAPESPQSLYPAAPASRRRPLAAIAALLALALAVLVWRSWDDLTGFVDELSYPRALRPTTPPPSGEPSIYDTDLFSCFRPIASANEPDTSAARLPGALGRIAQDVAALRGLSFSEPIDARLLEPARFKEKLVALSTPHEARERRRLEVYGKALSLLRVIPEGTDYESLLGDIASTQIAGFYVPKTKRIFATGSVDDPGPYDEFTLAHELEHALADQALGFPIDDKAPPAEAERQFAAQALIEGDATLTSTLYAQNHMTAEDITELQSDPALEEALEADIPYIIQRSLSFPYDEGLLFACYLTGKDGTWAAVDAAYQDPPASTAEILFPERFGTGDPPRDPRAPADPRGWRRQRVIGFGAFDMMTLFEAPNGEKLSERQGVVDRVRRWDGGEMVIWTKGDAVSVAVTVLDDPALAEGTPTPHTCAQMQLWFAQNYVDGTELDASAVPGLTARSLGTHLALLRCNDRDDKVRLVVAPDLETAGAILGPEAEDLEERLTTGE